MSFSHTPFRRATGDHDGSLHDALAAIVADCARARRERGLPDVAVTLDIPAGQCMPAVGQSLRRLIESLVRRAMESAASPDAVSDSPTLREVVVTGVDVGTAIEIEVADSGAAFSDAVRAWLAGDHDSLPEGAGLALAAVRAGAARIGGTVYAVNCPEGGVAVTLRIPHRQVRQLAA